MVNNWATEITSAFTDCEVQSKTWEPEWRDPMGNAPRYLVMKLELWLDGETRSCSETRCASSTPRRVECGDLHGAESCSFG